MGLKFLEVDKKALAMGLAMHLQGKENLRQVGTSVHFICGRSFCKLGVLAMAPASRRGLASWVEDSIDAAY